MKKITKAKRKAFLKKMLATNPKWAMKALVTIYNYQTEDEKQSEGTYYHNNIGFSECDAHIMTSLAEQYLKYRRLSEEQMKFVYKYIPRYWRQILEITDIVKLDELVRIDHSLHREKPCWDMTRKTK